MSAPQRGQQRGLGPSGELGVAGVGMPLRYTRFMPEWSDHRFLQTVFDETRVLRKPLRGIISGYHVLPYVLVGPSAYEEASRSVEVRGRIKVSPRLVLGGGGPTYGELFGEHELMDARIVARLFTFRYASRVSLESEELRIRRHEREAPAQLDRVLEELAQREIIDTAVISSPDARFYPVSLDRFIREILDQELPDAPGGV
jgi:hypothetical protein